MDCCDLPDDLDRRRLGNGSLPKFRFKIDALNEVHHHEIAAARESAQTLHTDNIWVMKLGQDLCLLHEAGDR